MWFAIAILGMIALAAGVSVLPSGTPKPATPPSASAPPPAAGTAAAPAIKR